jgi:integrase
VKVRLRDNSGIRIYRYVFDEVDRHGNVRIYFRRQVGQPRIRLRETPGTEAFDKEYQRVFRGETQQTSPARKPTQPTSLRWLCQQYYASAEFQQLAPSTRSVRRGILDRICARQAADGSGEFVGDWPYAEMAPADIKKLRDEKRATPDAANNLVKVVRQLFAWACSDDVGLAEANPAREIGSLRSANPDGIRAWTEADAARYEARHPIGTKARLAFDLLVYTGVRRSDVVKLGPQMERWFTESLPDGTTRDVQKLVFTEEKGRRQQVKSHQLPILPALRRSIDASKQQLGHLVYLVTAFGHPHSVKGFGTWFKVRCRQAGLTDLSAHGLRKLAAQRCAEEGATELELMALFGWINSQQAAVYTKKANRAKLEAAATARLQVRNRNKEEVSIVAMAERSSNKRSSLLPGVASGEEIRAKKP